MKTACLKREKIFALSQGMLEGRSEREARAHLEGCGRCREVWEGYRRLDSVLDEWAPPAQASPWFDARVRAAVSAVRAARPGRGFFGLSVPEWMALPAVVALLLVSSVVVVRDIRRRPRLVPSPVAHADVAAVSQAGSQELKLYQNLPVLEDYDMLADFDVISDLPQRNHKVAD